MPAIMTTDGLYPLMCWLSPGFPAGGFSYSHGLEAAVEAARVRDRADLERYIDAVLMHGAGHADATVFAVAWRAVRANDRLAFAEVAALAAALRGSSELALEASAQGEAFVNVFAGTWDGAIEGWFPDARASYPVAVACATAMAGIGLEPALTAYLQAVAQNLVSAGVRLIPLGQSDGQRVLAALAPRVGVCARAATTRTIDDVESSALVIDSLSMTHETQYTRLFRS